MLGTRRCFVILCPALLVALSACNRPDTTAGSWAPDVGERRGKYTSHLSYMVDNAILSDMSVADIHFIPHTSELSGVGEARLARMAKLLNTYGGTVRYETKLDDETMIQERLDHVREYLALTGCDMSRVRLATMMAGGCGMPGDEAVEKFKQGPVDKSQASTSVSPAFQGIPSP